MQQSLNNGIRSRWNTIGTKFKVSGLTKFNEFQYFTSITKLNNNEFMGTSFSEIMLPPRMSQLGDNAMREMVNLTELVLPASITTIGTRAIFANNKLKKVTVLATTPPTIVETGNFYDAIRTWYVPSESLSAYQSASVWSSHASVIVAIPE